MEAASATCRVPIVPMPMLAMVVAVVMSPEYKPTRPTPEGPSNIASALVFNSPISILMIDEPPVIEEVLRIRR